MRAIAIILAWLIILYAVKAALDRRAYTRTQQACQAYAREHVPDVDPVAWCEP